MNEIESQHPKCDTCIYLRIHEYDYAVTGQAAIKYQCRYHTNFELVEPDLQYCSEHSPNKKGGKHEPTTI